MYVHSILQKPAIIFSLCIALRKQAITSLNYQLECRQASVNKPNRYSARQLQNKANSGLSCAFVSEASWLIEWYSRVVAVFLEHFDFDVSSGGMGGGVGEVGSQGRSSRLMGQILQISLFGNNQHSRRHQTCESLNAKVSWSFSQGHFNVVFSVQYSPSSFRGFSMSSSV